MNQGIVILGAGGLARETYWHIRGLHAEVPIVFVDDVTPTTTIDMAGDVVPVIRDWKFTAKYGDNAPHFFIVAVGDPKLKQALVRKALDAGLEPAPTIIHPRALIQGSDCRIGLGGVITPGCIVTTNVKIGDFVFLNLNVTVGHDVVIGDYVTCNPGCNVSGNVTLGEGVSLGTNTAIRQKITIAPWVTTGAQACVVKDIDEPGVTVAGVPARKLAGS